MIKGVCGFCFSLVNVAISGVQGAMLPLMGIIVGARDYDGLSILFKQSMSQLVGIVGVMTVVVIIFPGVFYTIHGVYDLPDAAELSLRLYALHFVFKGCNTLFRKYNVSRKDSKFASTLTVVGHISLPLFAFLLSLVAPPAFIWLAYLITETVILALNLGRYRRWKQYDRELAEQLLGVLSLSVAPEDAVEASREIQRFADDRGVLSRVSYRVALCMEEMVAYAVTASENEGVTMQVGAYFMGDDAVLTILDDGKCIALDEDREQQQLITNNYDLVKRVADEVSYQYVLDLNYTVMHFSEASGEAARPTLP